MNVGKYSHLIVVEPRGPVMVPEHQTQPIFGLTAAQHWGGPGFVIGCSCITAPWRMETEPMKHDFDQIICFMGGSSMNLFDFGAEIELFLGEEQERHLITTAASVFIPKGMVHCPLTFTRVDSPILFMDISLTLQYTRRLRQGENWGPPLTLEQLKDRI
jgi:hypothetical protein